MADIKLAKNVHTYWKADVIETVKLMCPAHEDPDAFADEFLEKLQAVYADRWQRDPLWGEGAVVWYEQLLQGGDL